MSHRTCDAFSASLLVSLLMACGEGPIDRDDDPLLDPSAAVYARDRVLQIAITMAEEDWDELRSQARHSLDVIGETCNVSPAERPFTYFPADITIDGVWVPNVGVRKKGFFGTLSEEKPSLKVKFSEYERGQRFAELKRVTLNNNLAETSQIKQCLGYDLFARAGLPAPRCNFAVVAVNGVALGTYTNVEPIKKPFLRRHFSSDEGNLYEGALSDFRSGWVDTFERKTNKEEPDRGDLDALVNALESDDDLLLSRLEPLVDLPAFYDFWAMEILLMHGDGYARNTNNFYIYADPTTGQFNFIPWGIDVILEPDRARSWEQSPPPGIAWVEGALARRLYLHPEGQSMLIASLRRLLADVWHEETLQAEIDRMQEIWAPHITSYEDFIAGAVDDVRDYVADRRDELETLLATTPAGWDAPLRDPWCLASNGVVDGTFAGSWGSIDTTDLAMLGSGLIDLVVDNTNLMDQAVSVAAGFDHEGEPIIELFFTTGAQQTFVVEIPLAEYPWDETHEVEIEPGAGAVYELISSPSGDEQWHLRGALGGGTLVLDQVGFYDGAPIVGSFAASLYPPH